MILKKLEGTACYAGQLLVTAEEFRIRPRFSLNRPLGQFSLVVAMSVFLYVVPLVIVKLKGSLHTIM